jgi:hypothetical protein
VPNPRKRIAFFRLIYAAGAGSSLASSPSSFLSAPEEESALARPSKRS